jgi:hypothetical protein
MPSWLLQVLSYLIPVVAFGLAAFIALRSGKGIGFCAKAGAAAGAISGLFSGILNVLSLYVFPVFHNNLLLQVMDNLPPEAKETVTMEQMKTFYQVGMYVTIVTGPLVMALIGLIATVLLALILRAVFFRGRMQEKTGPEPDQKKPNEDTAKMQHKPKKAKKKAKKR